MTGLQMAKDIWTANSANACLKVNLELEFLQMKIVLIVFGRQILNEVHFGRTFFKLFTYTKISLCIPVFVTHLQGKLKFHKLLQEQQC